VSEGIAGAVARRVAPLDAPLLEKEDVQVVKGDHDLLVRVQPLDGLVGDLCPR